jgi:hypothetical protein
MAGLKGAKTAGFFLRDQLASAPSFESVVQAAATAYLMAPSHLIFAGTTADQGAVVTRNRTRAADVWRVATEQGRWWLVETNYGGKQRLASPAVLTATPRAPQTTGSRRRRTTTGVTLPTVP